MVSLDVTLTIVLMGLATYFTRIAGFLVAQRVSVGIRATRVLEAAPGCVLITVIAPRFVAGEPIELLALAITILAATRLSLIATVAIGVVSTGVLRHMLG